MNIKLGILLKRMFDESGKNIWKMAYKDFLNFIVRVHFAYLWRELREAYLIYLAFDLLSWMYGYLADPQSKRYEPYCLSYGYLTHQHNKWYVAVWTLESIITELYGYLTNLSRTR